MKLTFILSLACWLTLSAIMPLSAANLLTAGKPIELQGTHGKFDFIKIDSTHHRLLACHTGNDSLDVIDVDSSKLIKSVPTGAAYATRFRESKVTNKGMKPIGKRSISLRFSSAAVPLAPRRVWGGLCACDRAGLRPL